MLESVKGTTEKAVSLKVCKNVKCKKNKIEVISILKLALKSPKDQNIQQKQSKKHYPRNRAKQIS